METKTGFDLNQSVREWRDSLASSAAVRADELDELEQHLRDSMVELRARQLTEEESFFIATRRLGSGEVLTREFSKVNPRRVWPARLCWMIGGVFLYQSFSSVGSGPQMLMQHAFRSINGHWLGLLTVLFNWFVMLAPVGGFLWLTTARPQFLRRWSQRCLHHPVLTVIAFLIFGVVVLALGWLPTLLFYKNYGAFSPEILSRMETIRIWQVFGFSVLQYILGPSAVVYLARRSLKPRLAN